MVHLYNSLSKSTEQFTPLRNSAVTMYNCGPTVYKYAHIGNLRSVILADSLRRVLEHAGYSVTQVMNITDVGHLSDDADQGEDKVEKEARERSQTAQEITEFFTEAFFQDITRLNVETEGTRFPRASDHIAEQIEIIKTLEQKGYAYKTSDGVYFNIAKLTEYDVFGTAGSGLFEGARVEINSEKHNAADFALWKLSPPNETRQQEWDSPWGVGFPGWHLECSAMAMKYLGESIDIHTGGVDHKFPHHPNEIAQSESVTGKPFARFWLHNEFVMAGSDKMAKSGDNFITMKKIMERGLDPMALRYWFLTAHYRTPVSFSWEALEASEKAYRKLKKYAQEPLNGDGTVDQKRVSAIESFIFDDLDFPQALAHIWKMIKSRSLSRPDKVATLRFLDPVLGLDLFNSSIIPEAGSPPQYVLELLEEREEARRQKDWSRADTLRENIENEGFEVLDTPNGPSLERRPRT